jgi:membrane protein DedA with SNARE-associated domain
MRKGYSISAIATYGMLTLIGASLALNNQTKEEDLTAFEVLLSVIGLFLVIGATFGIGLQFARRPRKSMKESEAEAWSRIRIYGKRKYVQNFVVKVAMWIFVCLLAAFVFSYSLDGRVEEWLRIYGIVFFFFVGLSLIAGLRIWNYYEEGYRDYTLRRKG